VKRNVQISQLLMWIKMLENKFNAGTSHVKVSHWACCKEPHEENGFHYHCCLKLTGVKKWFFSDPIINSYMHTVMSVKLTRTLLVVTIILTFPK
jgi:hypothetical protein